MLSLRRSRQLDVEGMPHGFRSRSVQLGEGLLRGRRLGLRRGELDLLDLPEGFPESVRAVGPLLRAYALGLGELPRVHEVFRLRLQGLGLRLRRGQGVARVGPPLLQRIERRPRPEPRGSGSGSVQATALSGGWDA